MIRRGVVAILCCSTTALADDVVEVRGQGSSSPRGIGDVRVDRQVLELAPHQQTSEMLSAAPGFFVDHEDGEGLGNDIHLRGFSLEHGSGVELRLGDIPLNSPVHVRGQGYADVNFLIPELVRSLHVVEGAYDPRQGDAAIVGSARLDLAVPDRGYRVQLQGGSFGQLRLVGIAAPREGDEGSFAAFSARRSNGFGSRRDTESASFNSQIGFDWGTHDRLRVVATGYGTSRAMPGVVRQHDVDAGRIGLYGAYPYDAGNQSARASRFILGVSDEHTISHDARITSTAWVMATDFRSRQNYTGNLESSTFAPSLFGLGDLYELANTEGAGGASIHARSNRMSFGPADLFVEPGLSLRVGHTAEEKNLLDSNLQR